jgi:hypothetical protein
MYYAITAILMSPFEFKIQISLLLSFMIQLGGEEPPYSGLAFTLLVFAHGIVSKIIGL